MAQASAAASKVQITLAAAELTREPEIARINETDLRGLLRLRRAPVRITPSNRPRSARARGVFVKRTARVNPGLCMGCGTCVSVCPSKSADLEGFTDQEMYAMVEALV